MQGVCVSSPPKTQSGLSPHKPSGTRVRAGEGVLVQRTGFERFSKYISLWEGVKAYQFMGMGQNISVYGRDLCRSDHG